MSLVIYVLIAMLVAYAAIVGIVLMRGRRAPIKPPRPAIAADKAGPGAP